MPDTRCIARNTLMLYFRQILIMAVSLYTVRVVLAVLGAEDYGIYNVVAGTVTMLGFLSGAMATASQRYFAYDIGKNDMEHLKTSFSVMLQIYLLLSLVIILLAETAGLWLVNHRLVIPPVRMAAANWVFQCAVLSFTLTLITAPYMANIIAHERMSVYAYVSIMEALLKLGAVLLLRALPCDKLVLYGVLLCAVSAVNTALYRAYCRRNFPECRLRLIKDRELFREMAGYGGWNLFGSTVGIAKNQMINILLNMRFGAVVNAARGVAGQVNSAVVTFSGNFSTALRPQIIKTYAAGKSEETAVLVLRGCKLTFFLMYVLALPLCLEADFVLGIWLKNPPELAASFARLALIDAVIDSISYPLMTLAQATGRIRLYQSVVGGLLLMNLPLSYLALKMGFPAVSVMVVAIFVSIAALIFRLVILRSLTKFSIRSFAVKAAVPAVGSAALAAAVPLSLKVLVVNPAAEFLAVALSSVISCGICTLFVGMTGAERVAVIRSVKSKLGRRRTRNTGNDVPNLMIETLARGRNSTCTGCSACASVCPGEAVTMRPDGEGFSYPAVDREKCAGCGLCGRVCPALSPLRKEGGETRAYAARNRDEAVRLRSSSGGVFTALALDVIGRGGVVFGARFEDDLSVVLGWTDSAEGLGAFRGSKYVQGTVGSAYRDCRRFLEQGREVLFSGTPCQVQGLKKYLGRDYASLLCADFICHGVPSPALWRRYVEYREGKSASRTAKTAFRRKDDGWKQYSLSFTYANDSEYCACHRQDPYMQIFLRDVALRKSCYRCPARLMERPGDITLADFWGIQDVAPEMDDDRGTSLVIVHSERGLAALGGISGLCELREVSAADAVRGNPAMLVQPRRPHGRSKVYDDLARLPFEEIIRKYAVPPAWTRPFRLARRCAGRVRRMIFRGRRGI